MRTIMSVVGALLLTVFIFSSCSKDTDPADRDIFAGTFKGSIGYIEGSNVVNKESGSVFVTKVGANYNFRFSDGIPDLTGVEFEKRDDNSLVSTGSSGTGVITINASQLSIAFTRDGKAWSADCQR